MSLVIASWGKEQWKNQQEFADCKAQTEEIACTPIKMNFCHFVEIIKNKCFYSQNTVHVTFSELSKQCVDKGGGGKQL